MQKLLPPTALPPKTLSPKNNPRSGAAIMLAALCCLVLIPMLGLAIDGTNVFLYRDRITAGMNAAVLAANRSLNLGANITDQTTNAISIAETTFAANMAGILDPSVFGKTLSFDVCQDPITKIIYITGTVTAVVPLSMMGIINIPKATIGPITAKSQRRSVNIMLVLDHSAQMVDGPLMSLQADAVTFINMFVNNTDNIGLVTYTGAPNVTASPDPNFREKVTLGINSMTADSGWGMTNTSAAMSEAHGQLLNLKQPGSLNVIVLFTEGRADAFTGDFTGKVTTATICTQATSPPLKGVLWSAPSQFPFGGLSDPDSRDPGDTPEFRGAPGCDNYPSSPTQPQSFLSSMPTMDFYGNSTIGKQTVDLTRIDGANITAASENALDDAANRIRSNSTIPATIFVIGLGNNPGAFFPDDATLMPRIANDPSYTGFNSSQPLGQYIYAPSTAELKAAFTSIAAQVLKLAR